MASYGSSLPIDNRILAALPGEDLAQLLPSLEPVTLSSERVLYGFGDPIDYVYFPDSGMVSLVANTEQGETLEVATVGNGGMTGLAVFLGTDRSGHRTIVQADGHAHRIRAAVFKGESERIASLQSLLRRYTHTLILQITQSVICNRFHTVDRRLSRWLLQTRDCIKSNEILVTQEVLAQMLGTYRPGVTLAASQLQKAGLIRRRRGQITILEDEALEAASCECFRINADNHDSLFLK